jgi:hypothetical protein
MFLDKLINLKHDGVSDMSLMKALLIFYLIAGNCYTQNLYSGQLLDFVRSNRIAQHTVGFITLLVLITTAGGVKDQKTAIVYSSAIYLWFILTTKMDLSWNLTVIALLFLGYIYENNLDNHLNSSKNDSVLDEKHVARIKQNNKNVKRLIVGSIGLVTVVGCLFYYIRKYQQYNNDFDNISFMIVGNRNHNYLFR